MTYKPREIATVIKEALHDMPVVVITGMRQSGKSTFLKMEAGLKGRRYVTLDDFAYLSAAREDPDSFLDTNESLTIDEAQKCPELLTAIKKRVDKKRIPGQFLLSGSANFAMLKGITESLAGRAVYFKMHPFTRREINRQLSKPPFLREFFKKQAIPASSDAAPIKSEDVLTGGMPSVCLGEVKNRDLWFRGYEQTYLERDLRDLSQVGNIISFRNLLHLCALRTGQLLSLSQIGRDAKLNASTTTRYLSLLDASFIISRTPPYLGNLASRLIKSPKMYMTDSGLAGFLAGVKRIETGTQESIKGALFETYVAQNLAGIIDAVWNDAGIYFWSIQGRYEVDFIIEAEGKCVAIEVKSGGRWDEKDLTGLRTFISSTPHCVAGILAYNGSKGVKLGERLWAIPLSTLMS